MASQAVEQCIANMPEESKPLIMQFVEWMRTRYPELEEVVSFQMPTFKLGSGENRNYISFNGNKTFVSVHTMDFAMIEKLKPLLAKPGKGKGCVQIGLFDEEGLQTILGALPEIVARAGK